MKRILTFAVCLFSLTHVGVAQNSWSVISAHPRLLLNDTVADTWEPTKTRLTAIEQRVMGGNATATADFNTLVGVPNIYPFTSGSCTASGTALTTSGTGSSFFFGNMSGQPITINGSAYTVSSVASSTTLTLSTAPTAGACTWSFTYAFSNNPLNCCSQQAGIAVALDYAFAYAIYHKAGNDAVANTYAAGLWAALTNEVGSAAVPISSIVVSSNVATVTLSAAPSPSLSAGNYVGIWGASNDSVCGPVTIVSVVDSTHFTYASYTANATYTDSTMMFSKFWAGVDANGWVGSYLTQWAYFYDWCYPWLVANGYDQYARNQIKAGYWSVSLTHQSSQFSNNIRDADYHNYSSWYESATLEAGVALYGDDATGALALSDGTGYFFTGISVTPASAVPAESYTYNISASAAAITPAFNWESPGYWRNGPINLLRAIEAFDSGTARANAAWTTYFPGAKQAGFFEIYQMRPDNYLANLGDDGNNIGYAGRNNFGAALIDDRFPDAHFVWQMTSSSYGANSWNSGGYGQDGIVHKLIFYPYVNGPGSHDPTDLPLSAQFGPDIVIRSGWTATSSYYTYSSSIRGTYHRHEDGGTITLYSNGALILGQPYTLVDPAYSNYNRRTIGANTLTIYDPNDCWKENASTCGVDASSNKIVNDGGQLHSDRRLYTQFPNSEFAISRLWSGSLYSNPNYGTLYTTNDPVAQATFATGSGYEHIKNDLTPLYVNAYSGTGDNPTVKVASSNGVVREIVHFQTQTGGSLNPMVIFDRVTSTNASLKKSWLLHVANAPTVNGAQSSAGDTTYSAAAVTQADNGTGRLFVSHLLPASPKVRTVGGNTCAAVQILGATNANPAVYYAPAHGLQAGEAIGMATGTQPGTGGGPYYWPNWLIDRYFGSYTVGTVVDANHFTLASGYASNSTGYLAWTAAFLSGNGAPTGNGAFGGQVYYQQDATGGNTIWQWTGANWFNLSVAGYTSATGYKSPVIYTHASCNYAYFVDQYGPSGSGSAHLWNGSMDSAATNLQPNWMISESPSTSETQDYFLNVINPATTSMNTAPAATLISATGVYGAQIPDAGGYYVAAFNTSSTPLASVTYTAPHSGTATHVMTGVVASGVYTVTQSGTQIAVVSSGADGSLTFNETGGGTFVISQIVVTISTASPLTAGVTGAAYSQTLSATGGIGPYVWSLTSGTLPAGLSLSSAGVISGTPAATAISTPTLTAKETRGATAGKVFTLAVYPPVTITTTNPLPLGMTGWPYTTSLAATGGSGSYTWSVSAGSLPPGLSLSAAGTLSGTPTAPLGYNFTALATDLNGLAASSALSVLVRPIPAGVRPGKQAKPGRIIH